MRTTWIILLLTIAAAAGMYYYFSRETAPVAYDLIAFKNTPDSILQKVKVYTAERPMEVFYRDSTWTLADSTPLKRIMNNGNTDSIEKKYAEKTLFVTYDDKFFYDMDLRKIDSSVAYVINLQLVPLSDTMMVYGSIDQKNAGVINFRNPMANLFKSFVITYNDRIPDSLKTDTSAGAPQTKATKIITVLKP
ncbi:MAG: hypothetical protein EOO04_23425 [Chitinophagaceae bacterium]|nr:MAG: hypothetical protein EOO04_23425 [Chitinophagaceae bacterium]